MAEAKLAPSILTADFSALGDTFALFERHPCAGYIHMDVMDGAFVPNISFGAPVIRSLEGKTRLPFDIHLMVEKPERFLESYVTDNTGFITIHAEACLHLDRTLRHIRQLGVKCGVALNPATPEGTIDYVLGVADLVLVMSVNPGFGGQSFIPSSLDKLQRLADIREQRGLEFKLAVDGGINKANIPDVKAAGADIIVVGSAALNADDPEAELTAFDKLLCT